MPAAGLSRRRVVPNRTESVPSSQPHAAMGSDRLWASARQGRPAMAGYALPRMSGNVPRRLPRSSIGFHGTILGVRAAVDDVH
jgi:hypothetical protein